MLHVSFCSLSCETKKAFKRNKIEGNCLSEQPRISLKGKKNDYVTKSLLSVSLVLRETRYCLRWITFPFVLEFPCTLRIFLTKLWVGFSLFTTMAPSPAKDRSVGFVACKPSAYSLYCLYRPFFMTQTENFFFPFHLFWVNLEVSMNIFSWISSGNRNLLHHLQKAARAD